jgi:hypothetical protein
MLTQKGGNKCKIHRQAKLYRMRIVLLQSPSPDLTVKPSNPCAVAPLLRINQKKLDVFSACEFLESVAIFGEVRSNGSPSFHSLTNADSSKERRGFDTPRFRLLVNRQCHIPSSRFGATMQHRGQETATSERRSRELVSQPMIHHSLNREPRSVRARLGPLHQSGNFLP